MSILIAGTLAIVAAIHLIFWRPMVRANAARLDGRYGRDPENVSVAESHQRLYIAFCATGATTAVMIL
jgi:hypothetical protein